jgi:hypothetical protein
MLRVVFVGAFLVAGCTSVKSNSIETSGISAHMSIAANGKGQTVASAELLVDNNPTDYVDLSQGDSLVVIVAGTSASMSRGDTLGVISYSQSISGQDAPGTSYAIAFDRTAPAVSAPSSTCTIPAAFTVSAPASGASFSRANDAIVVTYGGSGETDPMDYTVSGTCVSLTSRTIGADSGSFTIPKSALAASGSQASESCQATLTITRSRAGHLDPAFGYGGEIVCQQARTVTFTSTP